MLDLGIQVQLQLTDVGERCAWDRDAQGNLGSAAGRSRGWPAQRCRYSRNMISATNATPAATVNALRRKSRPSRREVPRQNEGQAAYLERVLAPDRQRALPAP
jgi:hypothetical protein